MRTELSEATLLGGGVSLFLMDQGNQKITLFCLQTLPHQMENSTDIDITEE